MSAKRLIIILTALLLLTAALLLYRNFWAKTDRSVGEYTASIDSLIFLGDYSGAVTECLDGLRYYPENAELYILKARAYMLSGNTAKAIGTLDYGYKQTQSEDILEQREQIAVAVFDDAGFVPLTEIASPSEEDSDNSSAVTDVPGGETTREPYRTDTPIRITIPNVTPPAPPIENIEESFFESENGLTEN